MWRILTVVVLAVCSWAHGAQPSYAADGDTSCQAQAATVVGPLLQQASQFSPQGYAGSYVPLAQPFAPPGYAVPYGGPGFGLPAPPSLAPPTALYNSTARYTMFAGRPVFPNAGQIAQQLTTAGRFDPTNPDPTTLLGLANLQQTDATRQQQQALLQQQQGLYLNSLYQLSSSYQTTSLDWMEAYSTLAQAWLSYFRDLCTSGGTGSSGTAAAQPATGLGTPGALPPSAPVAPAAGSIGPGYPR